MNRTSVNQGDATPATNDLVSRVVPGPLGDLVVVASATGIRAIVWPHDRPARVGLDEVPEAGPSPLLDIAAAQLGEYFRGDRSAFDLPLDVRGTAFQHAVWGLLAAVPHGATTTYGELADRLGRPTAARAVGAAVGRNPVSVVVACHRVVGADGGLTGFAGGLDAKTWLLAHEARGSQGAAADPATS